MAVFLLNCNAHGTRCSADLHCELQRHNQHLHKSALDSWAGKSQPYLCFN